MKNYFKDCQTLNDAKKLYWELAKKLHPDVGGTKEAFQELQAEFEAFRPKQEKYKSEFENWRPKGYMDIIDQLMKIKGIVINICGSWIWLSGDTKPVKDRIKAVKIEGTGLKRGFSGKKGQWYFSPVDYKKSGQRTLSFEEIQALYGNESIEAEGQEEIAA